MPTLLTPLTLHQRIAAKYVNTARLRLGARFRHRALLLQRRNLEDLCFLDVLAVDRLPGTTGLTFVEDRPSKRTGGGEISRDTLHPINLEADFESELLDNVCRSGETVAQFLARAAPDGVALDPPFPAIYLDSKIVLAILEGNSG